MTSRTYAELGVATDLQGGDLLASYRGIGPLKSVTALIAKTYFTSGSFQADGSVAMTGALQAYAGSEALPGVAFSGDTDTGIYRVGANSVGIATGGVNRATFDSSGVTATTFIGNLTGNVTGNAATATKWATARNLSLTGDGTATLANVDGAAAVAAALTLAAVNANVGSFGSGTQVSTLTVNAKGLVTAASNTTISITDANLSAAVTVPKGGTGVATLTNHGVLLGQGASSVAATAAGTAGQPLLSGGASADPAFGGPVTVPFGGTGAATFTDAGVLIGNGAGAVQVTSAGTAGQLLTSNGVGVDPTFQDNVQGLVLLAVLTASGSASLEDTTHLTSTYAAYLFELDQLVPATSGADVKAEVSTDAGSSYKTTGYLNSGAGTTYIDVTNGNGAISNTAAEGGVSAVCWLFNPAGATTLKAFLSTFTIRNSVTARMTTQSCGGAYNAVTAINAIKFSMTSGNIASGAVRIYGLRKS